MNQKPVQVPPQHLAQSICTIVREHGATQAFVALVAGGQFGAHLEGDPEMVAHILGSMLARSFHGAQLEACIARFNAAACGTGESGEISIAGGEFGLGRWKN